MGYPSNPVVTDIISTTSSADTYATHWDFLGKGGHKGEIATIAARNAIPTPRRNFGMTVAVTADPTPANNKIYILANVALGGTDNDVTNNSNWIVAYNIGATVGGGGGVSDGDKGDITVSGGGTSWSIDTNIAKAWSGAHSFLDNNFSLLDNVDNTKILKFELTGITTGNTRTLTIPNASGTLSLLSLAQTWTARQTFTGDGTNAGLNIGQFAGNPVGPSTADIWYDSNTNNLNFAHAGGIVGIPITAAGTPVTNAVAYFSSGTTFPYIGTSSQFTYNTSTAMLTVLNATIRILTLNSTSEAGLRLNNLVSDPGTLANGYMWYNSTSHTLKARINGTTIVIAGADGNWRLSGTSNFTGNVDIVITGYDWSLNGTYSSGTYGEELYLGNGIFAATSADIATDTRGASVSYVVTPGSAATSTLSSKWGSSPDDYKVVNNVITNTTGGVTPDSYILLSSTYTDFSDNPIREVSIKISAIGINEGILVSDNGTSNSGFSYAADYSSQNVSNDRWIPDKGYILSITIQGSTGATDNAILRADGTDGLTLQASAITIDDSGNIVTPDSFTIFTTGGTAGIAYSNADSRVIIAGGSSGLDLYNGSNELTGTSNKIVTNSSSTNTTAGLSIRHATSATPAIGIGTVLGFEIETAPSNFELGASISAITTNITDTTEAVDLVFSLMSGGTTPPSEKFRMTSDGRLYGKALHNNPGSVSGATNQYIASGTYTPVATIVTNIDSITTYVCHWNRVGNMVTVSGFITIDATATGATLFRITLPIASNLAGVELAGVCMSTTASPQQYGAITPNLANDQADFNVVANSISTVTHTFVFTYIIN